MTLTLASLWSKAALHEAARTRATDVDVDHLYLGLLALGGSAARVLGRHGVTLAAARERVREQQAADLARLGVPGAEALTPRPLRYDELDHAEWRPTPRAQAVHEAAGKASDTRALLDALVHESSGTVRRLLAAEGVDATALLAELAGADDDGLVVERAPLSHDLLPAPATARRVRVFVPVPPDAAATALADPAFLRAWAISPGADASEGGLTFTQRRGRKAVTTRFHVERHREADAEVVTWREELLEPHAGENLRVERLELREAPGGAELVRVRSYRRWGVLGRLLAPLFDRMGGWGLLHSTQGLGFALVDHRS